MVTVSAPVDDHVSVLDCPAVMVDGVALAWIVGAGTGALELGEPELGEPELGEPEPGAMLVAPFSPRHPLTQKLIRSTRKQDNALQLRVNIGQLPISRADRRVAALPKEAFARKPSVLLFVSGRCQSSRC